jgi:hypothetical protein
MMWGDRVKELIESLFAKAGAKLSIAASRFIASAINPGKAINSVTKVFSTSGDKVPRARPKATARQASTVNWQVKALVEATPISGPASVGAMTSLSRAIVDVVTLTTERMFWPFCLA